MLIDKISIGTASFGMQYGILQKGRNRLDKKSISRILETCKKNGINKIDTAFDYGETHEILSNCLPKKHNFEITTKVLFKSYEVNELKFLEGQIINLLREWKIECIESLLFHKAKDINKEFIREWALELKNKGYIKNLGVSAYLDDLKENIFYENFDKIQLPFSCVDDRALNKIKELDIFNKSHHIISARSIYLQGILVCPMNKIPKFVSKSEYDEIKQWREKLQMYNFTPQEYCLKYVAANNNINEIIIGISSLDELKDSINYSNSQNNLELGYFRPPKLCKSTLDPRLWN